MADEPHPTAQAAIDLSESVPVPPSNGLSPASARDRLDEILGDQSVEAVESIHDYAIPGPESTERDVPVRVYEPSAEPPYPILLFFHGGGFAVGSLDSHENICAALTNRADCLTVSVDYRLAPEHPFPAGLEDCYAALKWAETFAEKINGDPDRIALAGDSAGGNLSAAVALLARDHGGPDLVHQGLIYPGLASLDVHEFDSHEENAEGYFLEMETVRWYYDNYVQSPVHARNEYAWPLLQDDLSGLPPATVVTACFDPVRDEGLAYAERLADDGVDVEHAHFEDMIHAFVSLTDAIPHAEEALDDIGERLRESFER